MLLVISIRFQLVFTVFAITFVNSVAAMSAQLLLNRASASLGLQNQGRNWVSIGSTRNVKNHDSTTRTSQTKLLFNEAIPLSVINRATRVDPPAPILIERLLPCSEMHESDDSLKSSHSFTVLSEERLQAAVKLAKRDLRRRHLVSLAKTSPKPFQEASVFETSDVELLQELVAIPGNQESNMSSKKKKAQVDAKQRASKNNPTSFMPRVGQSPPTRDPGLRQKEAGTQGQLSNEIRKLQNEVETYIRKVEELANRGEKLEESLEPEEQSKLEIRRQKQTARTARIIYVLLQQVKEIQDDIEKLRKEKMWETKKSVAVNRLAAAHRGALRALQVIIHQLSDRPHSKVPPHYKELGQLIRQLSLCSAKLDMDQGSAVPETAPDILQKLEFLDSALGKQERFEKMQCQDHPPHRKSPYCSTSPTIGPKSLSTLPAQAPRKPINPRRGVRERKVVLQKPKTASYRPLYTREMVMAGLQNIGQQRELKELQRQWRPNTNYQGRRHVERRKADLMKPDQMQDAGFRQPTVSSQLRVTQLPQKEKSVPWIPTSPHSPPQQQAPQRGRLEPRCLFSPVNPSSSPPREQQAGGQLEPEQRLSSAMKKETQNEAIRRAYQETMTTQRANQLSEEEALQIQRLRSEVAMQNQWAEEAEQRVAEDGVARNKTDISRKIWLSERAGEKAVDACEQLSETVEEDLLDTSHDAWAAETGRQLGDIARCGLQAPNLENMLLRMEEIQRDEEDVRKRFASIVYSDPRYWDQSRTTGSQAPGFRPASPRPIRLTKPVPKQTSAADIILEKPTEAGFLFENSTTKDLTQEEHLATNKIVSNDRPEKSSTVISVPSSMLKSIRQYKENYNTYLRAVSHGVIDSFHPWIAADSLAEELLSEALADVAKEFQDVVEEYAEAVFTSEFLQPIQSPPASAEAVSNQ
ncbi:protein moonraker isoform X2 [Girardinichthys multiradiatus]|uniref:protein moonraker isoform X2 n=1 Tax=Girardinichthys multiradiatus TaxID=208333 RepID=UPI001FACAB2C|nr:protein moonraker isoform X2 [Girardinichthys multiradiatus]